MGHQDTLRINKKDRENEYRPLQALVFELCNAQAFLSLVQEHPSAMLGQQIEELREGRTPELILLDARSQPRLLESP